MYRRADGIIKTLIIIKSMNKKRAYISGPISGHDLEQTKVRFNVAERILRAHGYEVCNPLKHSPGRWRWLYRIVGYEITLLWDLWLLFHCDNIYKLPGWENSRGSNIESCLAFHFNIYPIKRSIIKEINAALDIDPLRVV